MEYLKYKIQGEHPYPHIGKLVRLKVKERRITYADMARRMGINPSVFQEYMKQESIQLGVLWKIGIALEYNFLVDLMENLPEHILNSSKSVFQLTIEKQASEIENLKKDIEIYKSILQK